MEDFALDCIENRTQYDADAQQHNVSDDCQKSVANPSLACSATILVHSSKSSPNSCETNNYRQVIKLQATSNNIQTKTKLSHAAAKSTKIAEI